MMMLKKCVKCKKNRERGIQLQRRNCELITKNTFFRFSSFLRLDTTHICKLCVYMCIRFF